MALALLIFSNSISLVQLVPVAILISRKNEKSVKVLVEAFPMLINDAEQGFGREKLWKRELIAYESLKCWIGNMYYMKRSTKDIFFGFITNLLASLLVAF
jgi:hypothetical protein